MQVRQGSEWSGDSWRERSGGRPPPSDCDPLCNHPSCMHARCIASEEGCYVSYFSAAVIKYPNKRKLNKNEFAWACSSRRIEFIMVGSQSNCKTKHDSGAGG